MTDKKKKRPTRREVRAAIDDLRAETGDDPDGPTSVTVTHMQVELPDDAKFDADDPDRDEGADPGDATAEIRGQTRRIKAERGDDGEWVGNMVVDDADLSADLDEPSVSRL